MSRPTEIVNGKWQTARPARHKYGARAMWLCTSCCKSWPSEKGEPIQACCGHVARFASKREMTRYLQLRMQEKAGAIRNIELQPAFPMIVNGQLICKYLADFAYIDVMAGKRVVEDAKSSATKTDVYLLKKKLLKAIHGIDVVEV